MMRITADVRDASDEEVLRGIAAQGIRRARVLELREESDQHVASQDYRGAKYRPLVIKTRIEVDVPDARAMEVARLIAQWARTDSKNEGTVAIVPIYALIDIRTGKSIEEPVTNGQSNTKSTKSVKRKGRRSHPAL